MPVTKTAKRALRSSSKKQETNKLIRTNLDAAIRQAKKIKSLAKVTIVFSLADRAAKKHVIHKNKAARIKAQMSKLLPKTKATKKVVSRKLASKKAK